MSTGNTCITFSDGAAASEVAIRRAITALASRTPITWDDAARLVAARTITATGRARSRVRLAGRGNAAELAAPM